VPKRAGARVQGVSIALLQGVIYTQTPVPKVETGCLSCDEQL
jgi:hypothetical protein